MGAYKIWFDVNEDTTTLIYLADVYKIDLAALLFLYEKYGKDTFFFFYLFSGKTVAFPKASKLQRIVVAAKVLRRSGVTINLLKTEQERKVLQKIRDLYVASEDSYCLNIKVNNDDTREDDIRGTRKAGVCSEPVESSGKDSGLDEQETHVEGVGFTGEDVAELHKTLHAVQQYSGAIPEDLGLLSTAHGSGNSGIGGDDQLTPPDKRKMARALIEELMPKNEDRSKTS